MIEYSEIESQRFKKNIHRASLDRVDIKGIKKDILENETDVLILRIPSGSIEEHHKLNNMGFDVLHADTLVYYETDLGKIEPGKTRNDISFQEVDADNLDILEKIVPIIFKDYSNHYFSNPLFDPDDIRDGYVEWASSYAGADLNRIAWIACIDSEVAGFLTCSYDEENDESEGVLYGVLPGFAGRGVYSDFIRFSQRYFKDKGYSKMRVSTQIQNYAVQKVWSREGFFLKESYETYHVNACLSYSLEHLPTRKVSFSKADVEKFGHFSGDLNPLHFNDDFAKKYGFDSSICHGMLINTYFSKILGTEYPGNGTLYLDEHSIFFNPLYPDVEYEVETSLLEKRDNGLTKILFKVKKDNQVILLSYNALIS
jgi:acyl dehydratase/GNAT superfamily N-acetyltransferase